MTTFMIQERSEGGTPLLFWVKIEEMTDGRKASTVRASKSKPPTPPLPPLPLAQRLVVPLPSMLQFVYKLVAFRTFWRDTIQDMLQRRVPWVQIHHMGKICLEFSTFEEFKLKQLRCELWSSVPRDMCRHVVTF